MADDFWKTVRERVKANFPDIEQWHIGDTSIWVELADDSNLRMMEYDGDIVVSYWSAKTAINLRTESFGIKPRKVVAIAKQVRETANNAN